MTFDVCKINGNVNKSVCKVLMRLSFAHAFMASIKDTCQSAGWSYSETSSSVWIRKNCLINITDHHLTFYGK